MTKSKPQFGYKGNYGLELIIDLKGCKLKDLSKNKLSRFFIKLCDLIDMKRHGKPIFWEDHSNIPHLRGVSGIQFIETSNIVCHPLPMLNAVYINIFSCKGFNTNDALKFCKKFWRAKSGTHTVVTRV
jgi:S-adenosylmethionine decarboxylase